MTRAGAVVESGIAINPRRADKRTGSFKVNLATGRWSDFATGDAGGDLISLAAYLFSISHREAARRLAGMLGLPGNIASRGQRLHSRPSTRMRSPALARCRVAPTKMLGN